MRIHRGFLGWGIFLILAGAVPLAVQAGAVSVDQLRDVGGLWPLILVGIGVGLLLSRTGYGFIGGLIVAATFGLMVGGLLAGGVAAFGGGCGSDAGTASFPAREGRFTDTSASVDLELTCGDLAVAVAGGNGWNVSGQDRDGAGPNLVSGSDSLTVRSRAGNDGPFDLLGSRETWNVTLPDAARLDADLTLNAGSSRLDLAGASLGAFQTTLNAGSATLDLASVKRLDSLRIELNAGSIGLTLPNLSLSGSIEVNAGSVKLCVAPGPGLRIQTDESIVAGYDFEGAGLTKHGSTWETPEFDTADVKIDLRAQANAGSVSLSRTGGACSG